MHFFIAAIASFLVLSVHAAPQAPPDVEDQTPRSPDKCGPLVQIPNDPLDTCESTPPLVPAAAPFGILGSTTKLEGINSTREAAQGWEVCSATVVDICYQMGLEETLANSWLFFARANDDLTSRCQIGIWLPRDDIGRNSPAYRNGRPLALLSKPEAARKPTQGQCEKILNAVVAAGADNARGGTDKRWTGASINLKFGPRGQPGQKYQVVDGKGTGKLLLSDPCRVR
ncbi:MAG: hypothetical protein Q9188_002087 [Gyalolechia gomerana]